MQRYAGPRSFVHCVLHGSPVHNLVFRLEHCTGLYAVSHLHCLDGAVHGANREAACAPCGPAEGLEQAHDTVRRLPAAWPRRQVRRLCMGTCRLPLRCPQTRQRTTTRNDALPPIPWPQVLQGSFMMWFYGAGS